jgi:AcrR family transcriptional regulator
MYSAPDTNEADTATDTDAAEPAQPRFMPPPPPRTRKAANTRRLLMDVAGELFAEHGYSSVSMHDIAAAAHLTKGALYWHFRSKGQLLVEVIRWKQAAREHTPGFSDATTDPRSGVPLLYEPAGRDIRLLEVDAAAAARHDPDVAAGLAELYRERHEHIRDAMSGFRDPETAAWLVAALAGGIGMKESTGAPLPDPERLQTAIIDVLGGMVRTAEGGATTRGDRHHEA